MGPLAKRSGGIVGEVVGARSRCRNCGRPMMTRPGSRLNAFCSVSCFERYPLDACASMATIDLVRLVARRRTKAVTDAISTRQELEAMAVAVLREETDGMVNLNPDGFVPYWMATRRGADKLPYDKTRVEPEGSAPVKALAAERAYVLARGGGTHLRLQGGYASMEPQDAAGMARLIVGELPPEAMNTLAGMLGDGQEVKRLLTGPVPSEAGRERPGTRRRKK
jgi:hypothetical protein